METRFDTSDYELERPLPKGINKKVIELMKDVLGGKTMTKFVGLRAKTYSYLIDDGSEDKKAKGTKKCVIKRKLKACVRYFLSNFYFSRNDSASKIMKIFFISSKKLFLFSRYSNFCISVFPSFPPCQPLL